MPESSGFIRVIVVDDEDLSCKALARLISAASGFEVVATCQDGVKAIETILNVKPDLVFLDIQMPVVNGFDVLRAVEPCFLPAIVFVTAYDEYAVKAFEVNALDYLLKPYSQQRLEKALDRAKQRITERSSRNYQDKVLDLLSAIEGSDALDRGKKRVKRIMVNDNGKIRFLTLDEILWFEGADYYVRIFTLDKEYLHRESLKRIQSSLNQDDFLRIHKSTIVNLSWVDRICENRQAEPVVVLRNGKELRISRRRKKELMDSGPFKFGFKA